MNEFHSGIVMLGREVRIQQQGRDEKMVRE